MKKERQDEIATQAKTIDQLWFTWSKTGLDAISAGFRIRAASEGLKDIRSERTQSLNAYLYYSVPRDRDRDSALGIAPVCLTLVNVGQEGREERALLHKVYTGQDDYGRYGVYFIHLLMLPKAFTAKDAIAFWKSDLWQRSDKETDPFKKILERLSFQELERKSKARRLNAQNRKLIQKHLPFLVSAYLSKNLHAEKASVTPPKLYIVASDDDVALLIATLLECLPPQLVKSVTFTTYESRLREATTEIIGRCWYSIPDAELEPDISKLLPVDYQEELALNCYTGEASILTDHPQVLNNPLIEPCAQDATDSVLSNGPAYYLELLEELKRFPDLTVERFLILYGQYRRASDDPTQEDVERVLSPRSNADYELSARMLSRSSYQKKLLELALYIPGWWKQWRANIVTLRNKITLFPTLANALMALAEYALPQLVDGVQRAVVLQDEQSILKEARIFEVLLDLINCAAPAEEEPDLWRKLLKHIGKIKDIADFFLVYYWDNYAALLRLSALVVFPSPTDEQQKLEKSSAQIKEDSKLIEPFLKILLWPEFGTFLSLQLPLAWTEAVTKRLVFDTLAKRVYLREETVHDLEQEGWKSLETLFKQLSQESQYWATTMAFFDLLASRAYGKKMDLWFLLLKSPLGKFEQNSENLAKMVHLKPSEIVPFLKRSGPQYLPLDPPDEMARMVMTMFKGLAQGEHHQEKMAVLSDWLAAKPLMNWFSRPPHGEQHLAAVLTAANLNEQECGQFFDHYGKTYIPLYPSSPVLLNLFARYASLQERRRTFYLESWLACSLTQEILEHVLQSAHLQDTDKVAFLQQYGQYYLTLYPKSQVLLGYVQEFLDWLLTVDLALFRNREPSLTEKLLLFLHACSINKGPVLLLLPAQWLYAWLTIVYLMREPALFSQKPERVATCVEKILSEKFLSKTTYASLIRELSLVWLADERQIVSLMHALREKLPEPDMLALLYALAEKANEGLRQRRYAKTLLVPCLQVAASFQPRFSQDDLQEIFLQSFVNTLLEGIDEKTRSWLSTRAWPADLSLSWKSYVSQQAFHTLAFPSWEDRLSMWWEFKIAQGKMYLAVQSGDSEKMLQFCIEYITILTARKAELPEEYEVLLNDAWLSLWSSQGQIYWWDQTRLQPQSPSARGLIAANNRNTTDVATLQQMMQADRASNEAFLQMEEALVGGDIGRIVGVATAYEEMFRVSPEKVPDEWRVQVKAAWNFLWAWREAHLQNDLSARSRLLEAGQEIGTLAKKQGSSLLFTAYEIRYLRELRQFLAQQEAQWVRTTPREKILEILQDDLASQPQQTSSPSSDAVVISPRWPWLAQWGGRFKNALDRLNS